MGRTGLIAIGLLCALALGGCAEQGVTPESDSTPSAGERLGTVKGASLRMSWPGTEDTPGLRGDIVTLTAFADDTIDLTVILEDSDGKGVPARTLRIASTKGNVVSSPMPVTDANGHASVSITAKTLGQDVIHVSGAGARKTLMLAVRSVADTGQQELAPSAADAAGTGPHAAVLREEVPKLRELPGVTSWKTLAEGVSIRLKDGVYKLMLADQVRQLHGKQVKLQGFMMPLEQEEKQKHFLLTANPPTCFFCLPGGAESIIEVKCDQPVKFGFDPIIVSGRLEVIEDHDFGLIYRLTQATTNQ